MSESSTGGGTTSGHGGSGMAAWTVLSLRILRRVDGDKDLAPWVLAIAISEKVAGGVHGLAQAKGSDGRLLWFSSSLAPI